MSVFYRNIKQKRIELRMTQTELAKKVGYSDKSMIARIERGDVDIPQSKIMLFANALNMTPCSLMGWNDYDSEELRKTREEIIELQKYITEMDEFGVTDEKAEHHMTQLQGHLNELLAYTGMITPDLTQRLTEPEADLLDNFRKMSPKTQSLLIAQAKLLLNADI